MKTEKINTKIIKINSEGKFIKVYNTFREAGADNNVSWQAIQHATKRKNNKCGGYYWKYIDFEIYGLRRFINDNIEKIPVKFTDTEKQRLQRIKRRKGKGEKSI
jgi:hypothetical protein